MVLRPKEKLAEWEIKLVSNFSRRESECSIPKRVFWQLNRRVCNRQSAAGVYVLKKTPSIFRMLCGRL